MASAACPAGAVGAPLGRPAAAAVAADSTAKGAAEAAFTIFPKLTDPASITAASLAAAAASSSASSPPPPASSMYASLDQYNSLHAAEGGSLGGRGAELTYMPRTTVGARPPDQQQGRQRLPGPAPPPHTHSQPQRTSLHSERGSSSGGSPPVSMQNIGSLVSLSAATCTCSCCGSSASAWRGR